MITVTDISMHFGGQMLFEQVNLQLNALSCRFTCSKSICPPKCMLMSVTVIMAALYGLIRSGAISRPDSAQQHPDYRPCEVAECTVAGECGHQNPPRRVLVATFTGYGALCYLAGSVIWVLLG